MDPEEDVRQLCRNTNQMLLIEFVFLQIMDAFTTLLFLRNGVDEASPLIRMFLSGFGDPALALAAPKVWAIALGVYAWRSGRHGLLRKMNVLFALCVCWNVAATIMGHAATVAR